ncbi:MAG: choice-of-anchor D domain-containing protein, partial [Acidobacteria bacterium]|nr:choice-of-anchor D domain-containing protein [Acidobacteriota bacterium]
MEFVLRRSVFGLLCAFVPSAWAAVTASPPAVSFGYQVVGASSVARTVTLVNGQTVPLAVSSISSSGNFSQSNSCGSSLAPNASCTISIKVTPSVAGTRTGALVVIHGALNSPLTVALSAAGIPPVSLSPATIGFAAQVVNIASPAKSATLTNNQSVPVSIGPLATTGDFSQSNTCGAMLGPNSSCSISVIFQPAAAGTRTGTLAIPHGAVNSPITVALSGSGVQPVSASPAAVGFSNQVLGAASAAKLVTLTNNQSLPLAITSLTASADFSQTNTCGESLPARGTCSISLWFTPSKTGARAGSLTIVHAAANSPLTLPLSGTGIPPASLGATSVAFGNQVVNTASALKNVTLTNSQAVPLAITSISASGDYSQTNTCGTAIAAAGACVISLRFTPTVTGVRAGSLSVVHGAATGPLTASLSGTGVAPVSVSPPGLSFPNQVVNTSSAAKALTLTNNQAVPLAISSIAASGDFNQTNTCGSSVPAGGACVISVTFTPAAPGTRPGAVSIVHSAANSPNSLVLTGIGVPPVALSPSSLSFPSQNVGTNSAAKFLTLTNNQRAPLLIGSITASGEFAQTNTCGGSLPAAGACTISVTFGPATAGARKGTLTVTGDAVTSPQTIPFAGTGVAPIVVSPTSLSFTEVIHRTSPAKTVALTNSLASPLAIRGVAISRGFQQTSNCGPTLAAGASCTFRVVYVSTYVALEDGSLVINHDGPGAAHTVKLSGQGVRPVTTQPSAASGSALRFGYQVVGSAGAPLTATVTNQDATPLAIAAVSLSGDYGMTNACPATLAAKASCTVTLRFAPTATGARGGLLRLVHGASSSPVEISLTGIGLESEWVSLFVGPWAHLNPGSTRQLTATANRSAGGSQDLTSSVNWSSSDEAVAAVSSSGTVTAVSAGQARISAAIGGVQGSTLVTVAPVLLTPRAVTLTPLQTQQFQVDSAGEMRWSVDGKPGGDASSGAISAAGLYTPPATPGVHTVTAADANDGLRSGSATVAVSSHPGVFTWQYEAGRTGQNRNELALTPDNVNPAQFGRRLRYAVDGQIYTQPLFVPGVLIPGRGRRNVVYVATSHNAVYAFDADGASSAPLWSVSFGNPAVGLLPYDDSIELGITGTPVIDPVAGTLYAVTFSQENGAYVQRLHALDIATGGERGNSPKLIEAAVPGNGTGAGGGGNLAWSARHHLQRPGLLLLNGIVYVAFGGIQQTPYHGWLLAYDAATLEQVSAWNTTPDGYNGGIWMSGAAPAADGMGRLYLTTANGSFTANAGGVDYGDSIVMLNAPGLTVADSFTPYNQAELDDQDVDLGAGGLLMPPEQPSGPPRLLLGGGKGGTLYVLNRDSLGRYSPAGDG